MNQLLRQNRCGQQPKWSQLGLAFPNDPLHLKNVQPLTLSVVDEMAKALRDPELTTRWFKVRKWITVPQPGLPRGRAVEAALTPDEVALMVEVGQAEHTTFTEVRSMCIIFPVPELMKSRRRVIKHTKWFNDTYGRDTLTGTKLLRTKDLVQSVHDGKYAITLDFSAYFDQFELDGKIRPDFCFPAGGKWYRLTRLPMGMRQAVDVAQTVTEILLDFDRPAGIRADSYVDNVRFLGNNLEELIATAAKFIDRCREANVTINDIPANLPHEHPHEPSLITAAHLVHTAGEFLGGYFDYEAKTVCLAAKSIKKLTLLSDMFHTRGDEFTLRNFLTLFGLLFFALQMTRAPAANRYYALKEYSEAARRIQRDPGLLESVYKCSPSRTLHISAWVKKTLENAPRKVPLVPHPAEADFILVTDASGWGWGAILLNTITGEMYTWNERWPENWVGARRSAWSEPEAIARALRKFFPNGTQRSVAVLTDSSTAVGAFDKGRSKAYAVNRALLDVQKIFPGFNASWWHIPGTDNPTDPISRGLEMGDRNEATAHIRRLVMGLPREGGPKVMLHDEHASVGNNTLWNR